MAYTSSPKRVLIGIQARSTSKRFPRKVFEKIGTHTMLGHVAHAAKKAAKYLNTRINERLDVSVALLVPFGDEIATRGAYGTEVIQGPEDDVLARYVTAAQKKKADYIVRITADCPLIPPFIISKHVMIAVENSYDYLSNVWEGFRTAPDGFDCEVMSLQLLTYLDKYAEPGPQREHVTILARTDPPRASKHGCTVSYLHLPDLKLSVDTPEDLERVRRHFELVHRCTTEANAKFGNNTHRI